MDEPASLLPRDAYNEALIANAHPPAWANPAPAPRYNLVVLGAGTAGLVTALGAAGLGAKVALVERRLLGGDCLNVGCVPSKCLIRSSRVAAGLRDAEAYGVREGRSEADFAAVMERMRRLRSRISLHDSAERVRSFGVDLFFGQGRFVSKDAVEVEGRVLRFRKAVIATGARAAHPPVPGLVEAGFLTNENVFSLTERPLRLAVFGAGPLGCELAQAFQRLGSEVTIIQRHGQFLPREDPDAARILADSFRRDGIRILLDTEVQRVERSAAGKVLHAVTDGRPQAIAVDEILVGAGRAPNVEDLGLERAGVRFDNRAGVAVNDRLQTTNARIYAAGDVCLSHKFTHTADASARIVIQNALFWGRKRLSVLTVPWCTYTDPEIAHVGLYERDAKEQGIAVAAFSVSLDEVDRAVLDGETEGFVKIQVREGTDRILGATIVARHAGEMISEISVAMVGGLGLRAIAGVIHPYPTQAEGIKRAADACNRSRLTPFWRGIFAKIMAWQR
jgi:pyruvate/2-oxoglutarate dehydrogenase complex dihydrolipoamide dehydrogenase (E3) component